MEAAGSVVIEISGNIAPFEAALAKAQQMAATFDAQISAKLNGAGLSAGLERIAAGVDATNALLTKLTSSGTAASATLTKVAASTTATTEAMNKVTAATKLASAELASLGGSGGAGLSAGTVSARDFAAALEATGGNLSRITPQMLGLAAAEDVVAASGKAATASMGALGVAETEAAGLGAGVTREFSVLGAEVARGNFSRIPGSLIVMNERLAATGTGVLTLSNFTKAFGGLASVIFNPYVLGFLAISTGIEVAARAFGSLKGDVSEATAALEEHKKTIDAITAAYPEAAAAAKKYEEIAKTIPNSVATADLSKDIVTNATALDATLKQIENKFAAPFAAGGRSDFGGFGRAAAVEFASLSKELASGSIDAIQLQNELGKIRLDPTLSIKAHEYAGAMQELVNKAVELENAMKEGAGLKSIGPEGEKAKDTLFDLTKGIKDIGVSADKTDAMISKMLGTLSGVDQRFGVLRSAGGIGAQLSGSVQATVGAFQSVTDAVQQARQTQLQGFLELDQQLRKVTDDADNWKQVIESAGGKDNVLKAFGDISDIKGANAAIDDATSTVQKLFDALNHGSTSTSAVFQGLDLVRHSLEAAGLGEEKVNAFVDSLIHAELQMGKDSAAARQLNAAIQAIKDKTVNITVVTQQIGTGLKSTYDVPGGPVSVTRYGSEGDNSAGFTQQSYQVPIEGGGYGSQGGVGSGSTGVTVTRFGGTRAAGGPLTANLAYLVGENGPELVIPSAAASIIPNAQSTMFSQALANPQSGFTGTLPTANDNRMWTVWMNVESNTRRTFQILDEINTATKSSSSALGGSSSSSTSSTSSVDQTAWNTAFNAAFKSAQSNYQAAQMAGGGDGIVPFAQGLVASPFQIALNAAKLATGQGGTPSVGSGGATSYETSLLIQQAVASVLAKQNIKAGGLGFATGGFIAPGDTQEVRLFKSPDEAVGIFTPQQMKALRGDNQNQAAANSERPINVTINQAHTWNGNAPPSQDSMAEIKRQTVLAVNEAMRGFRGR